MFDVKLRAAHKSKDRGEKCGLMESVPANCWRYVGNPPHAQAWFDSVGIIVHALTGGSGINTYDTVSISVLWPDGETEYLGQYSSEELRLPNYIPRSQHGSSLKSQS
jgi:hypothetical protein